MVVAVTGDVSVCVAPDTPVSGVVVVIVWVDQPLVPLKVKAPTPPLDTFVKVSVGSLVLVNVQTMFAPAAVAAALRVSELPFNEAIPPLPIPVQLTPVSR